MRENMKSLRVNRIRFMLIKPRENNYYFMLQKEGMACRYHANEGVVHGHFFTDEISVRTITRAEDLTGNGLIRKVSYGNMY
jgi:hypothetical protein